jgi:biopolymer transport protein ExbB
MQYLLSGGFFIWPIVLESVIALWVIIERLIYFASVLPYRKKALHQFALHSRENPELVIPAFLEDMRTIIDEAYAGRLLSTSRFSLSAEKLVKDAERYLVALHLITQTAPLFGLLGTVVGMIHVFRNAQAVERLGDLSGLIGGIRESLFSTAAGLIVGIPTLAAYILFCRAAERFADDVDLAVSETADIASRDGVEVA